MVRVAGGSEWTLEDTIELKNINVSYPQVSIDMSYLTGLIDNLNKVIAKSAEITQPSLLDPQCRRILHVQSFSLFYGESDRALTAEKNQKV